MPKHLDRFHYDNPSDSENEITVYLEDGALYVAVADEKAVDSYNSTFECSIYLPEPAALKLRDYLVGRFPYGDAPEAERRSGPTEPQREGTDSK